jgi:vancomycin resistance protein VanJ
MRLLHRVVWAYAAAVVALWLAIEFLVDRLWPATLFAFGPRWIAAAPLIPLAGWAVLSAWRQRALRALGVLLVTACVLVFGVMDFRYAPRRTGGVADIRVMTFNLGASRVTAKDLDDLMRSEGIDVAALQECPFYDFAPKRFGWEFYYGGDLCLVSRFRFEVLDESDPARVWQRPGRRPLRFAVDGPRGSFQVLNVHFETIRSGLEAFRIYGWRALVYFRLNRQEAARDSKSARARTTHDPRPLLVVGDFNLPVESDIYRQNWGRLTNTFSTCGRGFGHTKFTSLHGIRIDHVLASEQWACTSARVRSSPAGGDHAPLIVDLQLR